MSRESAQPFRKGARQPGAALTAMTRGKTFGGVNPRDAQRGAHVLAQAMRTPRAVRRPRVPRTPR